MPPSRRPGQPALIAEAIALIGRDGETRHQLTERGVELVRSRTLESETARVAEFIIAKSDA